MRWTRNTIAAAVFGGALIFGSGAAAAGVLAASSHPAVLAVAPAAHAAPAKTTPAPVPTKTVTAPPAPVPAKTVTTPPPAQPSDWRPSSAPAAAPADSQFTNSVAVVTQYYQDITNHDYTDAWNLGGSNIAAQNGQTYDSWVTGYDTTASIFLVGQANWNSGAVQTSISAVQSDGSTNTYYGTYCVTNGVITSASIVQDSGASGSGGGSAPDTSGLRYVSNGVYASSATSDSLSAHAWARLHVRNGIGDRSVTPGPSTVARQPPPARRVTVTTRPACTPATRPGRACVSTARPRAVLTWLHACPAGSRCAWPAPGEQLVDPGGMGII